MIEDTSESLPASVFTAFHGLTLVLEAEKLQYRRKGCEEEENEQTNMDCVNMPKRSLVTVGFVLFVDFGASMRKGSFCNRGRRKEKPDWAR